MVSKISSRFLTPTVLSLSITFFVAFMPMSFCASAWPSCVNDICSINNTYCINESCNCNSGYHQDDVNNLCRKPDYGEICNITTNLCDSKYSCLDTKGTTRCLCNNTDYRTDDNLCETVSTLIEIKSNVSTTNSIEFTWTVKRKNATINIANASSNVVSTSATSYTITNLKSGTQFTFTFQFIIPGDDFYNQKNGTLFSVNVSTMPAYGDQCYLNSLPCDNGSYCVKDVSNVYRCLCNETQYRTNSQQCAKLDSLTVSGVVNVSTTNSVNFTWNSSSVNNDKAEFQILYGTNKVITALSNEGKVENLTSGTSYTFNISVIIPNNTDYPIKAGPHTVVTTWTVPVYGDECGSNPFPCVTGSFCVNDANNVSKRCLCNETQYRTNSNSCINIDTNLKVSVTGNTSSTNHVNLTWSTSSINNDNATFKIYNELNATTATITGGTIDSLQSGKQYNFSIVVTLPNNSFYVSKTGPSAFVTVWTVPVYGEECGSNPLSCDSGTYCVLDMHNVFRCLCNETHYRSNNLQCVKIENLKVSSVSNMSTSKSINLTWSDSGINNDNATFQISYGSNTISASRTGVFIPNLSTGTQYNISIVVKTNDTYYNRSGLPVTVSVWTVPVYGEECGSNPLSCDSGTYCVLDMHNVFRCLCNETHYRSNNLQCVKIENLKVSSVSNMSTSNSINLTWSDSGINNDNATFQISYGSNTISASRTGVFIPNLSAGTQYNISIVVKTNDTYYNRSGLPVTVSVWTVPVYGEECGSNPLSCDSGTYCVLDMHNVFRCLCNETHYRSNNLQCVKIENLKVSSVSNMSTSKSINLTWSDSGINNDNATFQISYGSNTISASRTGVFIPNLSTGTQYNISIVVKTNDTYYNRSGLPVTVSVWTVPVYGEECGSNPLSCDSGTYCVLDMHNVFRCLCNETHYRSNNLQCVKIENLKVSSVSNMSTSNSINLTWSDSGINNDNATFQISYGSNTISASRTGVFIPNLSTGTQYNISIVVKTNDTYYNRSGLPVTVSVWTVPVYGDKCEGNSNPCPSDTSCLNDTKQILRCLCKNDLYSGDNNQCLPISNLAVTSITSERSTTYVTLSWSSSNIKRNSSVFKIFNGSASYQANNTGGFVGGLQPGTQYNFAVYVIIPEDTSYPIKTGPNVTYQFWTYPARPGAISDVTLSEGKNDTYVITFSKSDGSVSKYYILIRDFPSGSQISNTSSPSDAANITVGGLIAGTTYSYSLYAQNGGGDNSEYTNGNFITNAAKSGPVSNFTVKEITNTSVTLSWQKPASPNGNITGYLLEVYLNGGCVDSYRFKCNNCVNASKLDSNNCSKTEDVLESFQDLENMIMTPYTIQNLEPYRNYTFSIYAINEEGKGMESHIQKTTRPGTPDSVTNIELLDIRSQPDWVGLKVSWTPGELTGPTNYTVCLYERMSLYNSSFKSINCPQVSVSEKKDNISIEFPNLKAFWNYSVQIKATTEVSSTDWVTSKTVNTLTNTPGSATFQVTQDAITATKLNMTITCPDENSRNGTISKYVIIIKLNNNDSTSENQTVSNITCPDTVAYLTNIQAEKVYSFTVIVKNEDFSSKESTSQTKYVDSRKPDINSTVKIQGSVLTSSEVQVTLCVDCILEKRQGNITKAGLVVCLEVPKSPCFQTQSKRKRSTTDYDTLVTWKDSKLNNFALEYRTTSDQWLEMLYKFRSLEMNYTIGNQTTCDSGGFCNGPLPENTKIRVSIIVCTAAGCTSLPILNLQTKAEPTDNVPAIVGGVVGGLLGLALIAAVVFLIIYFKRRPGRSRPHSSPFMELDRQSREVIKEHRPIKITDFKDQVKRLHKDSNLLFQDEFEDIKKLSSRFLHTSDEAKKESNRVKNRYVDILPYDHSRVKLEVQPEDDETMDFVNANYIPGYNSVREYIATQGPMHCTVPDFWKMVWEQKSRVIVMLSDLTEQGKNPNVPPTPKVTLYWPENLGEPINYGNVIVEMTNFSQLNKYIIRNFKLAKGSETRKVTHFFLPGWWDFSANLTTGDVLEFAQLVRQEATPANSGPIIVHCSAGVGRTGTFIALDYFMQYIEKHSLFDSVDIFSYVMKMRNNRPRMVQAETQYIFIFDALDEVIDRKIKYEQEKMNEHIYSNGGGDLYANLPTKIPEDSIYANTEVIKNEKNGIDNKAFEADYENMSLMADKSDTPTTVL